jgi:ribosomal protein L11 methyltransferase
MSAEWTPQSAENWKLSLAIDKATADRVAEGIAEIEALDPLPVVVVSEPDDKKPDEWLLEAYFETEPDAVTIALFQRVTGGTSPRVERMDDADWVTISQAFLTPIRAGRFYVHTAAHADAVPEDAIAFAIEASRAFGTGHHETTSGCLAMLSALADEGRSFTRIADIGTGTGLLAFAAHRLWPEAAVVATDIDPVALPVIEDNIAANRLDPQAFTLAVCDGTDHPALAGPAFDLVIANILAGPLIRLASDIARIVNPGGFVMLAGLLTTQQDTVIDAYSESGMRLERHAELGDWTILGLTRQEAA